MNSQTSKTERSNITRQKDSDPRVLVLTAANRVAHLLSKKQRIEEIIEEIIREFLSLVPADEASIQLLRPGSGRTQRTLIRTGGSGKRVLETYLVTHDILAAFKLDKAEKQFAAVGSALTVPFLSAEQAIGAINLVRYRHQKPFSSDEQQLLSSLAGEVSEFIEQAQLREQLFEENTRLKHELEGRHDTHGLIGSSRAMQEVFTLLQRVTPTDGRVMIQGESGTGKELIAKFIHREGPRKQASFVAIDCGALPANLLESELFGYVRGAFTGANTDRKGLFEEAHGGTIFLDEIANMGLETQAKLLRVLQEGEIRPLGSNEARKIDVRVISAASQDLNQKIADDEFRADLFYRLNVVPIRLPALRERVEDIPLLALHFLHRYAEKYQKPLHEFDPSAIALLENYAWPGNVRELENVIERAVILAGEKEATLLPSHLPHELSGSNGRGQALTVPESGDLAALVEDYERRILERVLRNHNWNQTRAAETLNISERVIRYKIKKFGLHPSN